MKKILSYSTAIIAGIIIYQLIIHLVLKPPTIESQLMKESAELNKNCPLMIDNNTRLDNTIGGPGKFFVYNYTLIHHTAAELNIVELKQNMVPVLTNTIKTSEDMQIFRREKVTLKYNYRDKQGVFLFSITISPDEYRK